MDRRVILNDFAKAVSQMFDRRFLRVLLLGLALTAGLLVAVCVLFAAGANLFIPETVTLLSVRGMTCASCTGRIEQVVRRIPGVHSVQVQLLLEQARDQLLSTMF